MFSEPGSSFDKIRRSLREIEDDTDEEFPDNVSLWLNDNSGPIRRAPRLPPPAAVLEWIDRGRGRKRQLARRIVYTLHTGVVPCQDTFHAKAESRHQSSCTRHRGLRHTYDIEGTRHGPSEAEKSHDLGIYRNNEDIPGLWRNRARTAFPSAERLQRLFSGPLGEDEEICLHKDAVHSPVQYSLKDVDSAIAIFTDLNSFQGSISLPIIPQPSKLLRRSVHLHYNLTVDNEPVHVPLHKIPHILFGTTGTRSHAIYAFFPSMYRPKCSIHVTDKMYAAFYEQLLLPGLQQLSHRADSTRYNGPSVSPASQHIPPSFLAAQAMSKATVEKSGKEGGTRGKPINITITPSRDTVVWNTMEQVLSGLELSVDDNDFPEFDLRLFQRMFFVYASKGLKLETQRQRLLSECIKEFQGDQRSIFEGHLSVENSNRQYIDIAAEVPPVPDLSCPSGSTLLAKRCCVYNTMSFVLEGKIAGTDQGRGPTSQAREAGVGTSEGESEDGDDEQHTPFRPPTLSKVTMAEYPIGLLRDTVTLTAEPKPNHPCAKLGLVYMQTYSPIKELFDARNILPFSHAGIGNLGYSDADFNSLNAIQKTHSDRRDAKRADLASRKRAFLSTQHTSTEYFGWRTEMRVTAALAHSIWQEDESWAAFLQEYFQEAQMQTSRRGTQLTSTNLASVNVNDITIPSQAFFVHKTSEFKAFLRGNIQKHLIAVDSIRALCNPSEQVPSATARLHALLTLSLRHFISHLRPAEAWILNSPLRRSADEERKPGFGLRDSMNRGGFAFFPPDIVNWRDFKIVQDHVDSITLPGFQAVARFQAATNYLDIQSFLDELLEIIDKQTQLGVCEFVLEKGVHLILQEYRKMAMVKMLGEDGARRIGHVSQTNGSLFHFHGLQKIAHRIGREVVISSGNKSRFKTGHEYFTWTWETEDVGFKRNHIINLPHRRLYHLAHEHLMRTGNQFATPDRLREILAYRFFEQHCALPYPDSNGSMQQVSKKQERVLFCFHPLEPVEAVPRGTPWRSIAGSITAVKDRYGPPRTEPAPVPACLDRIRTAEEAKVWITHQRNLICYT